MPTGRDIALRRIDYLMSLADNDLCREDHRTAPIPPRWPCGRNEITNAGDVAVVITCAHPGEWARKPRRIGTRARRGCACHIAAEIRAELFFERKGLDP